MALFKFTQAILNCDPINVYNQEKQQRFFTLRLVNGLRLLLCYSEIGEKI